MPSSVVVCADWDIHAPFQLPAGAIQPMQDMPRCHEEQRASNIALLLLDVPGSTSVGGRLGTLK